MLMRIRSRISVLNEQLSFADIEKMVTKDLTLIKGKNIGSGPHPGYDTW